jgi:LuxR family maltose regulon positive regulatory protein
MLARHDLTNRELDILELAAQRLQSKEIAARLHISNHTVKDHLKHIYQKLGVSRRADAVAAAIAARIIE